MTDEARLLIKIHKLEGLRKQALNSASRNFLKPAVYAHWMNLANKYDNEITTLENEHTYNR